MSLPKSWLDAGLARVLLERLVQVVGVEHVDAHARQRDVRLAGHGRRLRGLLQELQDATMRVHMHHAERRGLRHRHFDAGHGAARIHCHVVGDELRIVHLVDVVAGQHQQVLGVVRHQDVEVLVDGVGRAAVPPVLIHALLRGQQVDELVELVAQERPAALQVAQQAVRFVLREHADAPHPGVQAVGQREIDDAELAAEVHGRLGAPVGQMRQARPAAAGEYQADGPSGKLERVLRVHG